MATQGFLALVLTTTLLVLLLNIGTASARRCNSMTASYSRGEKAFLFFGKHYLAYNIKQKRLLSSGRVSKLYKNMPDIGIDAAYTPPRAPNTIVLISGNKFFRVTNDRVSGPISMRKKFPRNRAFARGIDAATSYGRNTYYFKGCVLNRKSYTGARHLSNLKRLGIPCDLDAAWTDNGKFLIVKGPFTYQFDPKTMKAKLHCFYC